MVLGKWLGKLSDGLTKTRSKLADGVKNLFRVGRRVDAARVFAAGGAAAVSLPLEVDV